MVKSRKESTWRQKLSRLPAKASRLQIAALCVRSDRSDPEILLVSTRDTGRLILPKGWPEKKKHFHETASLEAYEEAGVVGKSSLKPIGTFRSFKGLKNGRKLRTTVVVFKVKFEEQLDKFPEQGQRQVIWMSIPKAIKSVDEASLSRFLRKHRHEIS